MLCCSGATGVGVDRLARLLVELCPPADQHRPVTVRAGESTVEVPCDPDGPPLLVVAKTLSDHHAGKVSLCKVLSGTIRPDAVLTNPRTRADERLHVLQILRGHEATPSTRPWPGTSWPCPAWPGPSRGTRWPRRARRSSSSCPIPGPPPLSVAVRPASRNDDDKLMSALQRLCEEDASLRVSRDDETHQTVLGVAGEVHLAVTLERLSRKFGVSVEREDVVVPYRETIARPAAAEGRHKKQSGGHGQFGVCHLRIEPLGRGDGFAFHDEVVGGAIPRQYIPAVEKGVRRGDGPGRRVRLSRSSTSPSPCDDGKHHSGRLLGDGLQDGRHPGLPPGRRRSRAGPARAGLPGRA